MKLRRANDVSAHVILDKFFAPMKYPSSNISCSDCLLRVRDIANILSSFFPIKFLIFSIDCILRKAWFISLRRAPLPIVVVAILPETLKMSRTYILEAQIVGQATWERSRRWKAASCLWAGPGPGLPLLDAPLLSLFHEPLCPPHHPPHLPTCPYTTLLWKPTGVGPRKT